MKTRWLAAALIGLTTALSGCSITVREVSAPSPRYQAVSAGGKLYLVDTHRREAYPVLVRHAEHDDHADDHDAASDD